MTDQDALLHELAAQCVARMPVEGEVVVDRICRDHPEFAERLRGMVEELRAVGLVESLPNPEPREFGDFRILRRLGEGGMGIVYLAAQRGIERRVALKLLRPGCIERPTSRERFQREIAALSQVDHPGICTVYEAGEIDGRLYLAMRHVSGDTLANVLARRRKSRDAGCEPRCESSGHTIMDTLRLLEKTAHAVHAAHEAGLVHRDLKPGNIMVDGFGNPVVLDFGLVHFEGAGDDGLTRSGEILGTPAYMAPEQVSGRSSEVDRRTDVYALGAVLYECLTLQRPFESETRESLYRQILSEAPSDPRLQSGHVGPEVRIVLTKAMEKRPDLRFATALEFAEELGRIRRREPIRARSPGLILRSQRWCQRNRTAAALLATISAALVLTSWLLYGKSVAETRLLARALLGVASKVKPENPQLAFKLEREALRLDSHPDIVSQIQRTMFQLRDSRVLRKQEGALDLVLFSPSGHYLLVSGLGVKPTLYRGDGTFVARFAHEHSAQAPPAAFSHDDTELALCDGMGVVHVYRIDGAKPVAARELRPPAANGDVTSVLSVCYRRDDLQMLVAYSLASAVSTAGLWTRDGICLATLTRKAPGVVWPAAFLPDGRVVAVGALWTAEGKQLSPLPGHEKLVRWISTGADRFLTASPQSVQIWGRDGTHVGAVMPRDTGFHNVTHVEFSPDGQMIVVSFNDGRVQLHDRNGQVLETWRTPNARTLRCARFSPDGTRVAGASWAGVVQIWDLSGAQQLTLAGHSAGVSSVAFSPTGGRVASVSWDGTARVWSLAPLPGVPVLLGHGRPEVAVSGAGDRVVFTSGNGSLHRCDARGHLVGLPMKLDADWSCIDMAWDGRTALVGTLDHRIWLWDVHGNNAPVRLDFPGLQFGKPPQLLADGSLLVGEANVGVVHWNPATETRKLLDGATAFRASSNGRHAITGSWSGKIQLWELRNGSLYHRQEAASLHLRRPVGSVALDRASRRALVAAGNKAHVWDLVNDRLLRTFGGHQGNLTCARFSPDESRIVTSAGDGTIRLWDFASAKELVSFGEPGQPVSTVAFVDADRIVSAGHDGTVRWWCLRAEELRGVVRKIQMPELNNEDRRRFHDLLGR